MARKRTVTKRIRRTRAKRTKNRSVGVKRRTRSPGSYYQDSLDFLPPGRRAPSPVSSHPVKRRAGTPPPRKTEKA